MTNDDPLSRTVETRAGGWELDRSSADIAFFARGMWGVIPVSGRFRKASGFLASKLSGRYEVTVEIEADSVDTGLSMRDRHLRERAFLDAATYPVITFHGTGVDSGAGRLQVDGTLSVRGTTTGLELQVELAPDGPDLRASARTQVLLQRCGIRPPLRAVRPRVDLELRGRLVRSPQISPTREGVGHDG